MIKLKLIFGAVNALLYPLLIFVISPFIYKHFVPIVRMGDGSDFRELDTIIKCIFVVLIISLILAHIITRSWWIALVALVLGLFISWAGYVAVESLEEFYNENYNQDVYQDTFIGLINSDMARGRVYVKVTSKKHYRLDGDISECIGQHERATIKIVFGDTKQTLILVDEESFYYPYAGFSSLSYELGQKGELIRKCRSSRHPDTVYVDAVYEYDATSNNFFKTKEVTQQSDGGGQMDVVVTTDKIQVSIDKTTHRVVGSE